MSWSILAQLKIGGLDLQLDLAGDQGAVALVGPNGAGKTTTLRAIAGALRPKAGLIVIGDTVCFDSERGIDLPPEKRRIGYVPQGCGLFPHMRALDNVAFGLASTVPKAERRERARALLETMQCAKLADRWPGQLSGGEAQRVALARALLTEPKLLLLDEPLSALDVEARAALREQLGEYLQTHQVPALVITHEVRDIEALDATVFVLQNGGIAQSGTVRELAASPATAFVRALVA